ncbi:hypothetical protein M3182_02740 [Mesobacillus maritimus]|uniref:hypothetical protein n=1 Tax=Mesobacillus maritimus TaxID=1643336 RepID=UPI00203CA17D|nr:hypothetical protein [Mesobacillus maritimus]MCM3584660.1 hypothetical protein [Mesobacillus maritimus]MCM3671363.1 hypothetical protein [Mesobacillus maritimus]
MGYMENELIELEKGTIYTTNDIAKIISKNKNALVLSEDTSSFQEGDRSSRYLVKNKIETYIHQNDGGKYAIPSSKQLIYIVKKCS